MISGFRPSGVHIPSNGKGAPLPLPNILDNKIGKSNIGSRFYNRYNNGFNQYDPHYGNNARNHYGNNRYEPYRYDNKNNFYNQNRFYPNDARYNANRYDNGYPGFVPFQSAQHQAEVKKD